LRGSSAAGGRGGIARQEQRAFGFACDVRQPEQCRRLLEFFAERCRDDDEEEGGPSSGLSPPSLPGLDVLVNGAAGNFLAAAEHLSPRGFETVMAIDALGTFNVTSAAFPYLRRSSEIAASLEGARAGDGAVVRAPWRLPWFDRWRFERYPRYPLVYRPFSQYPLCIYRSHAGLSLSLAQNLKKVINISATLQYGATYWQIHASAAKAAVDSMTRSWALEWGHAHGIRVVGIAPGPIAGTPGTAKLAPTPVPAGGEGTDRASNDPKEDWIPSRIPLGRMGDAAEIGHAVVYLCASQYVTGTVLVVDGGEWLSRHAPLVPREKVAELSRRVEKASRGDGPRGSSPLPPPPQRSKL
jgi:NAD(P)-dependent dehydrogenase (short-subunit alcohol dehydrogenase family)